MPIFDYKCKKCGKDQERIVKNADDKIKCNECGSTRMTQIFPDKFSFQLKGQGWFKTGGY